MTRRGVRVLTAAVSAALLLAACGGGPGDGDDGALLFWTIEDTADRVQAQERLLARFTERTGIPTRLVAVAENQLTAVLTSAAAAGDLPDVIGSISLPIMSRLRTDDLLDTDAATQVVAALGAGTFAPQSLELTRQGDAQLVVPSDGWAQLLFYRKDLFAEAGLAPPTSFDAIRTAAERLDRGEVTGITASTTPADVFTHQTFEHLALANGCELVADDGRVALDSPACVAAFRFYADLVTEHSASGNQDVDTTRATYFAGRSAMVVWSSYLLDELAGLRDDALPTCPPCRDDPAFLARNTGVVAGLTGPDGDEPTTFGETASFALLKDAATEDAKRLVEYLMGEGYRDWLAIAPEGKVPVRAGTAQEPRAYVEAWRGLDVGVDTRAPLSRFYDAETLRVVQESPHSFRRWGFAEGRGELAGAVAGQLVVPKALAELVNGSGDAADAARSAQEQALDIADEIGG
ncbi:extracellular solute-binding protein [Saccharothrix sp. BKS2]|uniref:ABC transporter substrate-binding protein n=1 Tax=Saccharothrix sp. BKS2 TaxID=3064400 RepID=UPI0039E7503C